MSDHIEIDKTLIVKKRPAIVSLLRRKGVLISLLVVAVVVIVLALVGVVVVVIPAQKVYTSFQNILSVTDKIKLDLEEKDLSNLDGYVLEINAELDAIDSQLQRYEFLQGMEFTKGYYENLQIVRQIAAKSSDLLSTTLPELKVLLSSLGYQVDEDSEQPTTPGEDEDQISSLIQELPQVIKLYETSEPEILEIVELFNQINPAYIPTLGSGSTAKRVSDLQSVTKDFPTISAQIKGALRMLPELLGAEKKTTYLVIFQNEKEMRSSGGLLSAFGLVTIDKGELVGKIKVSDMWDLEGYVSAQLGVDVGYRNIYGQNWMMNAHPELRYSGCGSSYLRAQDAGIYPDLYITMDMVKDYYNVAHRYNPTQFKAYDHIVIINTFFASDLVSLIEPIKVPGSESGNITSKNVAKKIFSKTSQNSVGTTDRKKFIGQVATVAKEKFVNMSASEFPDAIKTIIGSMQAKNVALYSKNKEVQAYFDELGLSGRIEQTFDGDYFHLNEAQVCSLKINFYLTNEVIQNISINSAGRISKGVRVKWRNEKIYDPREEYIYSKHISKTYRAWVRLFTPKGTTVSESDGYARSTYLVYTPQVYFDEKVKKLISDNIIQFDHRRFSSADPVKTQELNVKYTLPKSLNYTEADGYRMLIQKHPGKDDEQYQVNISHAGKVTTVKFVLDRDKVLTYKNGIIKVENYDTRLDDYIKLADQLKALQSS